jgi:hypothetical protein
MTVPPIPGRRVIQIAAIPESEHHSYGVIAVCDDNTIWEAFFNFTTQPPRWDAWEEIPQPPGATSDLLAALKGAAAIVHDQLNVIMSSSTHRDGTTLDDDAKRDVERFTKALAAARKAIDAAERGTHGR